MNGMHGVHRIGQYMLLSLLVLALTLIIPVPAGAEGTVIRDFSANVTSGAPPLTVLFTDISTIPVVEDFRRWDFGDGTVAMDPAGVIVHTYVDEGIYTVRLDRTDSEGYHSLIKYAYIAVAIITPTPTPTTTTVPTTSPVTTATTIVPTTPTTVPTTTPTTQPTVQIPSEFYGQATSSAGPVPPGSSIIAKIGSRNAGNILVATPGLFGGPGPFDERLEVYATTDEIEGGPVIITFWLDGTVPAGQTAHFQSGSAQNLALAFGSVTPTITTTTMPTTTPSTTVTTVIPTPTATTPPVTTPSTTVTTVVPTTTPTHTPTITPTITPTGTPGLAITCEPGWNYVSFPRVLAPGADTGAIFGSVNTAGHSVWRYNGSAQLYERVYPVTHLSPTESVWVYSSSRAVVYLYFAGQQGFVERPLFSGWNGFGIPNLTEVPARDALHSVNDSWKYAYGFDSQYQRYDVSIVNGGGGSHSDARPLAPGRGYWLYMFNNATFRTIIPDL